MIQPNEIRLINWIQCHDEKMKTFYGRVSAITLDYVAVSINEKFLPAKVKYTECDHIALTHELLEKAGFKLNPRKVGNQLQNLYFALTGKELHIELSTGNTKSSLRIIDK